MTTLETNYQDSEGRGVTEKWISEKDYKKLEQELKQLRSEFNLSLDSLVVLGLNLGQIMKLKAYYEVNTGKVAERL